VVDPRKAKLGQQVFTGKCVICHGIGAVAGGYAPDLRASAFPLTPEGFSMVVRQGTLEQRGMPKFSELTDNEMEAMRHYIRKRARDALVKSQSSPEKSQ
jgi:quinohemoprotein ethanol dehydrogenase